MNIVLPRGLRNCNPTNIKKGSRWIGLSKVQTDNVFCQFVSMSYGYRAFFYLLRKYVVKYNLCTVAKFINRWCPVDNTHYKDFVVSYLNRKLCLGINQNDVIFSHYDFDGSLSNVLIEFAFAVTLYENGNLNGVTREDIETGYKMLLR